MAHGTPGLTVENYFAACALIGLLASQGAEPDPEWACEWATDMGRRMAAAALKRKPRRQRTLR